MLKFYGKLELAAAILAIRQFQVRRLARDSRYCMDSQSHAARGGVEFGPLEPICAESDRAKLTADVLEAVTRMPMQTLDMKQASVSQFAPITFAGDLCRLLGQKLTCSAGLLAGVNWNPKRRCRCICSCHKRAGGTSRRSVYDSL